MSFSLVREEPDCLVVKLAGELDIAGIETLRAGVEPALHDPPRRLVIDAAELRFADSSAIAIWVAWAAQVAEFELRHASPLLGRVIGMMGLSETLGLRP